MKGRPQAQNKARELRREGKSLNDICDMVGASKSSVSAWVRDVELSEEMKSSLLKRRNRGSGAGYAAGRLVWSSLCAEKREKWREEGRQAARKKDLTHAMGCMLYWAEGNKDRSSLGIANSDAKMLRSFVC